MYYKEFLRVRSAVINLAVVLAALTVVHVIIHVFILPWGHAASTSPSPTGVHVTISSADSASKSDSGPTSFVALFGGVALIIGGIMATVLGSTIAGENEGHLALAWTKPRSRTEYATAAMLVNAAGIMACVLLAFVVLVVNLGPMPGQLVSWHAGPSAANDLARFALFPLAWYALIVALSARLRGAGLVQVLIWPVAMVMVALTQIPFGPFWHGLFQALNIINPLGYVEYHEGDFSMLAAGPVNPSTFAVLALVAFVVGGWALATTQWRKLEA